MQEYYLGRQPIFDVNLEVTGYELLYRSQDVDTRVNGDQATSQVLLNSFWEMGLEKIVGKHAAFVNLTRRFILNESLIPPPNGQLVLEILEDIEVDDELLTAVGNLKSKGYTIALDDFIYHPKLQPLVRMADIIKIDILALSHQEIDEHLFTLRKFPLKLLAEKVETPEEFDWCKSRGFDYYQGYFLCKPRLIKGRRMPTNRVNTLRLMAELQKPDLDVKHLENLISQDVTISYRLLHYINSAAFAAKDIESIHHAIVYLGKQEICKWASLALLAGIDDKPAALTMTALVRARMCELLAETVSELNPSTAMMIGLFSTLDAMLDAPLEDILADIPLADGARHALLEHAGPYAGILTCTLAYETGTWEDINFEDDDETRLISIYLRSIEWAETMLGNLKSTG